MDFKSLSVKAILLRNRYFILPYLVFVVLGAVLLMLNNKADMHLEFNTFHASVFDLFFRYITYLGDGWTALIVGLLLLVIRLRWAFLLGLSCLISAFITQFLKHSVFVDALRPKKYFEGIHQLYFVPGVENYLYNSFPSGHSTCAFSMCLSLALISEKNPLKLFFFFMALLIGYSRIYLSQHFFEDVYAGAFIGVSTGLLVYYFLFRSRKTWLDKSLISVF